MTAERVTVTIRYPWGAEGYSGRVGPPLHRVPILRKGATIPDWNEDDVVGSVTYIAEDGLVTAELDADQIPMVRAELGSALSIVNPKDEVS